MISGLSLAVDRSFRPLSLPGNELHSLSSQHHQLIPLSPHQSRRQHSVMAPPPPTPQSLADPPVNGEVVLVTDRLEKPSLDDRSYRVICLPNQLEALIVHDPKTDKASAAMDVNVGSFSDEDDMPGMAHAVEHVSTLLSERLGWLRY